MKMCIKRIYSINLKKIKMIIAIKALEGDSEVSMEEADSDYSDSLW
jgi:hypothetical protein